MTETKQSAQEKAIKALRTAEAYDGENLNRMERYAVLGLAWATLAQTLPNETEALKARPFREVVQ